MPSWTSASSERKIRTVAHHHAVGCSLSVSGCRPSCRVPRGIAPRHDASVLRITSADARRAKARAVGVDLAACRCAQYNRQAAYHRSSPRGGSRPRAHRCGIRKYRWARQTPRPLPGRPSCENANQTRLFPRLPPSPALPARLATGVSVGGGLALRSGRASASGLSRTACVGFPAPDTTMPAPQNQHNQPHGDLRQKPRPAFPPSRLRQMRQIRPMAKTEQAQAALTPTPR